MSGLAQIIGWALFASLVQAGIIAAAVGVALRFLSPHRAKLRHAIGMSGLLVISGAFVATTGLLLADWHAHVECWETFEAHGAAAAPACRSHGVPAPAAEAGPDERIALATTGPRDGRARMAAARGERSAVAKAKAVLAWWPGAHVPTIPYSRDLARAWSDTAGVIGALWLAVLLLLSVREVRHRRRLSRLVRESRPIADPAALAALADLRGRLGVQSPVKLRESADVSTPCVAGTHAPVLLLPKGLLAVLNDRELRAVLAHELAHVCRRDPSVLLLQRVAAWPLFFNPFVARISSWIVAEREAACDRIGAAVGARSREDYAEALLVLEGFRSISPAPGRALPLLGESGLPQRLQRLLAGPVRARRTRAALLVVVIVAVLSAGLLARLSLRVAGLGSWAVMAEDNAARATPGG